MNHQLHAYTWILATLLTAACGGTETARNTPPARDGDVLDLLNVKKTESPVTDSQTRHPLQKKFTTYMKRSELYLSGVTYTPDGYFNKSPVMTAASGRQQFLLDDKKAIDPIEAPNGYRPLYTSAGDQTWTKYPSASVAANLSGNGRESAVVLYRNPTTNDTFLHVLRRSTESTSGYEEKEYNLGQFFFTAYAEYPSYDKLQVAAGDFDNDGNDELLVLVGNTLVLEKYMPQADTFADVDRVKFGSDAAAHLTSVAVGNVDDDAELEFVVADGTNRQMNSCAYYVYSVKGGKFELEAGGNNDIVMEASNQPDRHGLVTARTAIGDLDGDGLNEVIFAGDTDNNQLAVVVMKYNSKTSEFDTITSTRKDLRGANWTDQYLPALSVFSPEGVTQSAGQSALPKELLVYKYILHLNADNTLTDRWSGVTLGDPWYDKVVVGDFSGTGKDYVAYYSSDNATSLQIWGYESGSFHQVDHIDFDPNGSAPNAPTLCAVNIDNDSTTIKYKMEYEMLYSQPQIVAVLAFPPYYEGQDVGNASTTFGWEETHEEEEEVTHGVYLGFSVGFSWQTPFWGSAGSSELKFNFDSALDFKSTTTKSWSGAASKSCTGGDSGGEPCVVFSYTPIDVYYYEVVSSPKPEQVGQTMSIQIPRQPRIADTTLANYNEVVDEQFRVPATLKSQLESQIGHPERYPSRSQMLQHFTSDPPTEGFRLPDSLKAEISRNSNALNNLEMTMGSSTSSGTEFNLQVGFEAENVAGSMLVGGRIGYHYGYSQSETIGTNTIIGGVVPGIPAGMNVPSYVVGLFAYPETRSDGGEFLVVNYWFEP